MNVVARRMFDRRALGRAISRAADATVDEILGAERAKETVLARRIGITGSPGAGKSTLIASLARYRLERAERVAVIAIDPSSPKTQGAMLGDRIRMDRLIDDPRIYIRSLASRGVSDGLAENMPEILAVLDDFGFDEIIVETVGVGQSEVAVRDLVDVELLVMTPGAGDQIQAMKAGILETADIYVVNKADQPGAARVEAELRGILSMTLGPKAIPAIVQVHADADEKIQELNAAIEACARSKAMANIGLAIRRQRARHRVKGLMLRRLNEVLQEMPEALCDRPVQEVYDAVIRRLLQRSKA
jgi:LAO/AO transport system kinase